MLLASLHNVLLNNGSFLFYDETIELVKVINKFIGKTLIKSICLGRRNYLFCGSKQTAKTLL